MAISTYDELKQAIVDWLERSDLSSHADTFIDLAEARFKRELRIREMEVREDLAIAKDDRYVDLPGGLLDVKYLRVGVPTTVAGRNFLRDVLEVSQDELTQRSRKEAYCPKFFTIWDEKIEFDCPADQAYTGEIFYWTEMEALSDSVTSNGLLARAPDVYLYASLSASAPFLMNDERIPVWEGFYQEARDTLNRSEREYRRSGPLTVRLPNRVF